MLGKILEVASLLAMAFAGLFWAQNTFMAASDWAEYQYRQSNEEVLYLQDKQLRLQKEQPPQQLEFEDSRRLQRSIEERDYWKQQTEK